MSIDSFTEIHRTSDFKKFIYEILVKYDNKPFNLMISGGSLLPLLDNEAYGTLITSQWNIFYADERCHQGHLNFEDSKPFLSHLRSINSPIQTDLGQETAVKNYKLILINFQYMDVCLLGIGDNGHICSLWPETEDLDFKEDVIGVKVDCPLSPDRVTITLEYINNKINDLYFIVPPKNGIPKKVTEPHLSIKSKIHKKSLTVLPEI